MPDKSLIFGIGLTIAVTAISFLLLLYQTPLFQKNNDTLTIACTTSLIADAATIIGGKHVTVIGLMGPGVDPHIYRAREHDLHALTNADIIFYHGLHLEGKMEDIFHNIGRYKDVIAITHTVPHNKLLQSQEFSNVYDPHIWFDVSLWIYVIGALRDALTHKDPAHAADYRYNAQQYIQELEHLDAYIKTRVQSLPEMRRILISAHDAFGYFGKAYGFTVIGLQGLSTDSEASMRDIEHLTNFIINHKLPAIFIESSLPRRTIEAVQQAVEAHNWHITIEPELYSDALGSPDSDASTYTAMIKHNIDAIVDTLSRSR